MQSLSKGAAQAGAAIDIARQLESRLEALGAEGKGLHEKTGSVEARLPEALVRKLRFVASVRNKLAHEDELMPDEEFAAFAAAGLEAIEELGKALPKGKSPRKRSGGKARRKAQAPAGPTTGAGLMARTGRTVGLGGLAFLGSLAIVALLVLLGSDGLHLWAWAFAANFLLGWHFLRKSRRASRPGS